MRIFSRTAFMDLPEGVLFSKGQPWFWDGLNVKGETLIHNGKAIDFGERSLLCIEAHDSGDLISRYELMHLRGASFPMEDAYGRDGCFDDNDLFLVWESEDLSELLAIINRAMQATLPSTDDGAKE